MPYPHGSACTCPPLAERDGLIFFTVSCEHQQQLRTLLDAMRDEPEPRVAVSRHAPVRHLTSGRHGWRTHAAAGPVTVKHLKAA